MEEKALKQTKSRAWFWWPFVATVSVLVIVAGLLYLRRNILSRSRSNDVPISTHPTSIVKEYAEALELALQFFDVQKSGNLVNNRIPWRGNSALGDGSAENLDLSKGMYDAGDHIKFGFPLAFTATMLSWAILEYGDQMSAVQQLGYAMDSLKWITDYFINAHPSPNLLYIQVGDPEIDHKCWQRPETMEEKRPLTQVNISFPGTEVAAETAAAMAAASLVFKKDDIAYSRILLSHAEDLFNFADTYRGSYSISIPQVQQYYNSSGYGDELLWAAAWLYHATEDPSYLKYVTQMNAKSLGGLGDYGWLSWDDKHPGLQVLLSRIDFFGFKSASNEENLYLQLYRESAENLMCKLLPDSPTATSNRTAGGLIWAIEWNALQNSVASAFLAVLFSDYMLSSQTDSLYCSGTLFKSSDLRNFAISQVDYVLGKNPLQMSYLVGYGDNYPRYVHHRGASIPVDAKTSCSDGFTWLNSTSPNPNVAVGALVGGPFLNDTYNDSRNNTMQGEPTTYNSALLVALLSGLVASSSLDSHFT